MDRSKRGRVSPKPENDFIQKCRDVFNMFDSDGKGTITQYKLSKVMKMYGWRTEHKELQVLIYVVKILMRICLRCEQVFHNTILTLLEDDQ